MNIIINATILDEKPSGLGIYTQNIIKELSKMLGAGHQLIVYTSYDVPFDGLRVIVRKVSKYVQPKYGKWGGVVRFIWTQVIYPLRLIKDKADIVYNTTHHAIFLTRVPQIMTIHDLLPIKFSKRHITQHYYFKYVLKFFLHKCLHVFTVSENSKKDIHNFYHVDEEKINVIYNGYNEQIFQPVQGKSQLKEKLSGSYMLMLGASYSHKNVKRVIEAFAKVKHEINCDLVISGGRNQYIESLKECVKNRGLGIRVHFIDYVPFSDLPELYSRAKIFLFPSLYEGFGIPVIEAMACGCPVLTSNVSSLPEVCGNAAYYVDPYSVDNIAAGMTKLLEDVSLRQELIQKGFERIKMFSWEKSAKQILDIIRKIDNENSNCS